MPDDIDDDPWTVSDEQKLRFAGIFLLEYMINHPRIFQLWLEDKDEMSSNASWSAMPASSISSTSSPA